MPTTRIIVTDSLPLDGTTPLPADTLERLVSDPVLGISKLVLAIGEALGEIDPAALGLGISGSFMIRHLAVISDVGAHSDGSIVAVRSPAGPGGNQEQRTLVDMGPTGVQSDPAAVASGVYPLGFGLPVPVGHFLVLDTTADGAGPGPHTIQITWEPVAGAPVEIGPAFRGGPPPPP